MPDDPIVAQTVTSSGSPVPRRVPSLKVAHRVFDDFVQVESKASTRRARYKALADGAPPYDQTELAELGLGYITNVNFREAQAILDQKAGQFLDLFFEVQQFVDVQLVGVDEAGIDQPRMRSEAIIAEEFTTTLRNWTGFLPLMDHARRQADLADVGVAVWRDDIDWRPLSVERGAFFPEPYAKVDVATWDAFGLSDTYRVQQLIDITQAPPDEALAEGWNIDQVKSLLAKKYGPPSPASTDATDGAPAGYTQASRWEWVQQRIRNNDPELLAHQFDPVKVKHLFVRETKSGKISHYVFDYDDSPEITDFLCKVEDRYDSMTEAVWILPYNYGDGFLRSVRGLASMIEAHCDLSNRFLGRVFDAAFLTSSLMLQPSQPGIDPVKSQIVRAGPVTMLPHDLNTIQQATFAPPLAPLVQLRDLSTSVMRNNTGVWKQHPENTVEAQGQKTARQVAEEASKEARLEKSSVAFDYEHIERLYREMFRRMVRKEYRADMSLPGAAEAADFVARCVSRGVPEEWIDDKLVRLYASRSIGLGSWGVQLDITNQLLNARGLFDEAGRKSATMDWLAARVGWRNVARYVTPVTRDQIASNEHSIAALENNDMREGAQVPVGADQTHVIHFDAVGGMLKEIAEAVSEQIEQLENPEPLIRAIEAALPHAQEHLQYLSMDPSREAYVQEGVKILKAATTAHGLLMKLAEQLAKEQAALQQSQQQMIAEAQGIVTSAKQQRELEESRGKLQIEAAKQDSINNMRAERNREMLQLRREAQQADIALKQERQNAELELARQKAAEGGKR